VHPWPIINKNDGDHGLNLNKDTCVWLGPVQSSPTIYFLLFRIIFKSLHYVVVNGTSSIAVSNCDCVAASVLYEPSEQVSDNVEVVRLTPSGLTANVNNSSMGNDNIFIAYRRADPLADCNVLTIVDICVIVSSKVHQTP